MHQAGTGGCGIEEAVLGAKTTSCMEAGTGPACRLLTPLQIGYTERHLNVEREWLALIVSNITLGWSCRFDDDADLAEAGNDHHCVAAARLSCLCLSL